MPIKGARYAVTTTKTGKKVRLAIRGGSRAAKTGTVVEAKNLATGATHTPAEFAAERAAQGGSRGFGSRLRRAAESGRARV